jgi:glucose/arabinose dehydrogenase
MFSRALTTVFLLIVPIPSPAATTIVIDAPVRDNTLYEDPEGDLSNGSGQYLFMGMTDQADGINLRRSVLVFDLSQIPPNAAIDSVEVRFEINQAPNGAQPGVASLHRLVADWGEGASNALGNEGAGTAAEAGDATWLHSFYDSGFWISPGGDFESGASASAEFANGVPETMTFASTPGLVADVQAWIGDPSSNHGWLLRGDEETRKNARRMASRECGENPNCFADPPRLTVSFTTPSPLATLELTEISAALTNPIGATHAGDGSGRLFIVEQEGIIRIYDTNTETLLATPFLDIRDVVLSHVDPGGGNEQGLLGLAFHPDFENNARFYVNYTRSPAAGVYLTVVAEHEVSGNPDVALSVGETILEFAQDARNHNGGDLHFGPDGYLYVASGDGGGSGDVFDNAQNPDTLKGAILRIDVDGSPPEGAETCGVVSNYGIPPGNAYPGSNDGCDEILHRGLRNPWRISFDAENGDLWIADVGQGEREEINHVPAGAGGLNFGWPCFEGTLTFDGNAACEGTLTFPVIEYAHDVGCSVTGGFRYRGGRLGVAGRYFYGDWCSRRIWTAGPADGGWFSEEWSLPPSVLSSLSSFGQDENCELYVTDREGGALYRIDDSERLFGSGFERLDCR